MCSDIQSRGCHVSSRQDSWTVLEPAIFFFFFGNKDGQGKSDEEAFNWTHLSVHMQSPWFFVVAVMAAEKSECDRLVPYEHAWQWPQGGWVTTFTRWELPHPRAEVKLKIQNPLDRTRRKLVNRICHHHPNQSLLVVGTWKWLRPQPGGTHVGVLVVSGQKQLS